MENKNRTLRPAFLVLLVIILSLGAGFLGGYLMGKPGETDLHLQVIPEKGAGSRHITSEELGGNHDGITYVDVAEATITLDGEAMLLEHAIRDGLVTVEEIIAQAQEDARNKLCVLKYKSYMGITDFVYSYRDQYDLMVRYDVFECSDGKQHLISDVMVTPHTKSRDVSIGLTRIDKDGNPINLLYEDWGLEFTVTDVSNTGISLYYSQQGGMSVGALSVKTAYLFKSIDTPKGPYELETEPIPIVKNSFGTFSLNWEAQYGQLSRGDYILTLYIYDTYNEEEIHPLIRKYCHGQYFEIPFTVS